MNWVTRYLLGHLSYVLGGFLLLIVLLFGIQMGEARVQRAWDVEKQQAAVIQAKQAQHVTDTLRAQKTINQEISNEYQTKKIVLADLQPVVRHRDVGLCLDTQHYRHLMPTVSATAAGITTAPTDALPDSASITPTVSYEQLALDAAQTTLMVLVLQQWYVRQADVDSAVQP